MTTTNSSISLSMSVNQAGANAFAGGPFWQAAITFANSFPTGSAAGQADLCYMNTRTVGSGAADAVDLVGVLTDAIGSTISAAHLIALLIINAPASGANTTALTVGAGANPFVGFLGGTTPTIGPLQPGACLFLCSNSSAGLGTPVNAASDTLTITNAAGASNTYQLGILARSA